MIKDRIRDWLIDTVGVEVPAPFKKYLIIVAASIVGGYAYGSSGSWLNAIRWDVTAMFVIWFATKIAEIIGEYIVKLILFFLPE